MNTYDLIIIGAGPAGMTAGLYAARRAMKAVILTMDIGGQVATTPDVENYPGIGFVKGMDLAQAMYEQTLKAGCEIKINTQVGDIEKRGEEYVVKAGGEEYSAPNVILSFGKTPRKLGVEGDEEYRGKGVTYCATCDGPLYKNKTVVVVGGGNSAIDAALYLEKIAKKVYLVHRRDQLRGEAVMIDRLTKNSSVEMIWNSAVEEVLGDGEVVTEVKIKNIKTEEQKNIATDGVFVEIGFEIKADFVKSLVKTDEAGQIIVDEFMRTSDPNIFAVGDLTPVPYKQIIISGGQGAIAALTAYDDNARRAGRPTGGTDWGSLKK